MGNILFYRLLALMWPLWVLMKMDVSPSPLNNILTVSGIPDQKLAQVLNSTLASALKSIRSQAKAQKL
ncbi:hypothetical protein D0962_26175 [Leptolyngbyaceae cyanobacterium CCMR0082]|uniref:Uncharacterized protein n=2 Tax=Adonisia turfae TaxID=2950184 RepID=A0A6M0SCK6_9CYAN|nr:hypothetical protein [Adonisia turfae]MDV3351360.1 hypothetical protein [Leptothoe sp. LEGE 181152]NEZ60183.1 hypothetical protein [Adonisia turfae CCMR0081]NEZ66209.1 hypothetical protein [Adonisia turfae CCMR0082]